MSPSDPPALGAGSASSAPRRVRVFEVGPRDGLQNEARQLSLEQKSEFIHRLVAAGLRDIEIGAFVHPLWVPQMADTDRLVPLLERSVGVNYWALVPNVRGLDRAHACGIDHVCLLASATETHSRKNLNRAIAATMADNAQVARRALELGMTLRGYVSVAFGCPYEGAVEFARVLDLAQQYFDSGVGEVSLGDTTGMGRPLQVRAAARTALDHFGAARVAFHFHDTRGTGLTNAYAALEEGAEILDSSTGGIGGCPYAPGAAGNLATDDLVNLLAGMGIDTAIDVQEVVNTTRWLREGAGISPRSRYFQFADSQPL